ncbi:hypothetical protein B0J11DRAFT_541151 [Dendryphion nanum]|uniref:NmrA-like domain-containing protein n=1 Tax=Dendryphion nanum TaxID=256645 RepID=A0A9P9D6P7_9PLEO|nr:hypothetical protein B0J11DRAFT_541151 [Dendryphion nanum]
MAFINVMLIGANGTLGAPVLQEFVKSSFQVTLLSREESKSAFPPGIPVRKANHNDLDSLKSSMEGQDVVISMIGLGTADIQQKIIDSAIAAGVKRFIPSEFCPDTRKQEVVDVIPTLPAKVHVAN